MERINVNVSDLCLWETNPRVEPSIDQMDELNKIYNFSAQSQSTSKRQLMNLASSIAENGYQNDVEPILATRAGGFHGVLRPKPASQEGRRFRTSLKRRSRISLEIP